MPCRYVSVSRLIIEGDVDQTIYSSIFPCRCELPSSCTFLRLSGRLAHRQGKCCPAPIQVSHRLIYRAYTSKISPRPQARILISSVSYCLIVDVNESSANTKLIARILRLLATNYIYTEVAPDTFAHNRTSSVLDTGKSVEDVLAK